MAELEEDGWIEVIPLPTREGGFKRRVIHLGPKALVIPIDDGNCIDASAQAIGARPPRRPSDPGEAPKGALGMPRDDSKQPDPTSSFFAPLPEGPEEPRTIAIQQPASPAEPINQARHKAVIAALIALNLLRSKFDPTPVIGELARKVIGELARFAKGGLRHVAWAVHAAHCRPGREKGPVKYVTSNTANPRELEFRRGRVSGGLAPAAEPGAAEARRTAAPAGRTGDG